MSGDRRIGQVIDGRFRVLREIGRGGMGVVYEAEPEGGGRRVALKVLIDELANEPRSIERFRREALAAAKLQHPNIVAVSDFQTGESTFIVMELLEGCALYDELVTERRLPEGRACAIVMQVLSALESAHRAGIVHRDIKPANVFLVPSPSGEIAKLLDFGVAKLAESDGYMRLTTTGKLVGTVRFAAPEQLKSEAVDARTDIFAVGVLLYCMLAGRPPFQGAKARLLVQICEEDPPDLLTLVADIHPGLTLVVNRAIAKRPTDRFASAAEMATALAPFARELEARPTIPEGMLRAGPDSSVPSAITAPERPTAMARDQAVGDEEGPDA